MLRPFRLRPPCWTASLAFRTTVFLEAPWLRLLQELRPELALTWSPDSVGGTSALPSLALAQDVVASRIAFTGVPEFDPCPYLDDKLRDLYLRPKDFACSFSDLLVYPPR
ncbi:unnamed protein product, partial [Symbiodinium necroappetens]